MPTTTLSESDLRAALTPDLADVLDYLRAYEQHEGATPTFAELVNRGSAQALLDLHARGYVRRDALADDRAVLTAKGVQAVCTLERLDEQDRGITRCPVDGSLQWIDDARIGGDWRDPSMVLTLACGHVSL